MSDKNYAIWYIHLQPGDYKTGKIYKEYWGEIPNFIFADNKALYDYIDKWIKEYRELEKECNHNFFFRGKINYEPLNVNNWGDRIKNIFSKIAGVPVTPKEMRKMFVTFVNENGASYSELKGISRAMHHSLHIQENDYKMQDNFSRLAPALKLTDKLLKEAYNTPSNNT